MFDCMYCETDEIKVANEYYKTCQKTSYCLLQYVLPGTGGFSLYIGNVDEWKIDDRLFQAKHNT